MPFPLSPTNTLYLSFTVISNISQAYGFSTTLETPEKSDAEFDDFDADEILSGIKLTPLLKNKDGTPLGKNDPATPDSKTSSLAKVIL